MWGQSEKDDKDAKQQICKKKKKIDEKEFFKSKVLKCVQNYCIRFFLLYEVCKQQLTDITVQFVWENHFRYQPLDVIIFQTDFLKFNLE